MLLTVVFAFALLSSVHAGNSSEFISKAEYEEMKLTIDEMKKSFEVRLNTLETQKSQSMYNCYHSLPKIRKKSLT